MKNILAFAVASFCLITLAAPHTQAGEVVIYKCYAKANLSGDSRSQGYATMFRIMSSFLGVHASDVAISKDKSVYAATALLTSESENLESAKAGVDAAHVIEGLSVEGRLESSEKEAIRSGIFKLTPLGCSEETLK